MDGVSSIRDGDTLVSKIEGSSVEIYAPFTSPNSLDDPQIAVGDDIDTLLITAVRSKAVNGQVLTAPNEDNPITKLNDAVKFTSPNFIDAASSPGVTVPDFTTLYAVDDVITVTTADVFGGNNSAAYLFGEGPTRVIVHDDGEIEFLDLIFGGDPGGYVVISGGTVGGLSFNGLYKISPWDDEFHIFCIDPGNTNIAWTQIAATFSGAHETPEFNISLYVPIDMYANFTGVYTVTTVTATRITLLNPENSRTNNSWVIANDFDFNMGDDSFGFFSYAITIGKYDGGVGNWVGPFVLDTNTMDQVIANFVGTQGMYKDDGTTQIAADVDVQLGCTPCNAAGDPTGPEQYFTGTIFGSATEKTQCATTIFAHLITLGRVSVRAQRITAKDLDFEGQVSDEVRWRDVYAVTPVEELDFGNVTTVQTVTRGTEGALAVSERQINMLVTRCLPLRISGSTFDTVSTPTKDIATILSYVCKESKLGNRAVYEIDFDSIYDTVEEVIVYFDIPLISEFNYTFDSANVSFEEMVALIADAAFCRMYRQGSVLKLFFEKATQDSKLLFNHRNKVPGTEVRTVTFGPENDGIEYQYVSPEDDSIETFYLPIDRSAIRPKNVESIGIRSLKSATLHAWRLHQKLIYKNTTVEFDALQESAILVLGNRVLVADNSRADVFDGDVQEQDGFVLKLSQPFKFTADVTYVIFLQHKSGTVESIGITAGVDYYHVVLDSSPSETLVTDDDASTRALYMITPSDIGTKRKAFLVEEKDDSDGFTSKLTVSNYSNEYYAHDKDFAGGLGWVADISNPGFDNPIAHRNSGTGEFYNQVQYDVYFGVVGYTTGVIVWSVIWSPTDGGTGPELIEGDPGTGRAHLHLNESTFAGTPSGLIVINATVDGVAQNPIQMAIGPGNYNDIAWGPVP